VSRLFPDLPPSPEYQLIELEEDDEDRRGRGPWLGGAPHRLLRRGLPQPPPFRPPLGRRF
jgi:hypothetical protein